MTLLIQTDYFRWPANKTFFNTWHSMIEIDRKKHFGRGFMVGIRGHMFVLWLHYKRWGYLK